MKEMGRGSRAPATPWSDRARLPADEWAEPDGADGLLFEDVRRLIGHRRVVDQAPDPDGPARARVGTLCAYGREDDAIRVYEIDPDIVAAAKEHFTYISGSKAKVDFVLGDGRLSLERELRQKKVVPYDIIVLDAFSGDSIPVHLLTREAFGVYLGYLARGGILAVHITNQYLNLRPILANVTAELGLESRLVVDQKPDRGLASTSHWVLVARDEETLESGEIPRRARMLKTDPSVSVWTDQFSNLLEVSRVDPIAGLRGLFRAP